MLGTFVMASDGGREIVSTENDGEAGIVLEIECDSVIFVMVSDGGWEIFAMESGDGRAGIE